MAPRRTRVLAPALVLLAAGAALGQNALGDGTALDRNLQVGSDGRNPRSRDVAAQIRFQNAVVTGNAPGGMSFRGDVGYRAPGEFRGNLPSDRNYAFRRDAAYSALAGQGVRPTDALRYQFALTTGQALPGGLSRQIAAGVPREFTSPGPDYGATALRSTADYVTMQAIRPATVGAWRDGENRDWTAVASPLIGITRTQVDLSETPDTAPPPRADGSTFGLTTPAKPEVPTGLTTPAVPPTGAPEGQTEPGRAEETKDRERPGIDSRAGDTSVSTRNEAHTRILDAFRSRLETSVDTRATTKPEPDPGAAPAAPGRPGVEAGAARWESELERIRRALRGERGERADTEAPPKPGATPDDPQRPLTPPAGDVPEPRRAPQPGAVDRDTLDALRAAGTQKLDRLAPLPGDVPPDRRIAAEHMEVGQELLAQGRYFDAEERFTRAVRADQTDPMAKVGRIHAQLGAGLYLSAATNLRELFESNPELVGATFEGPLTPSDERAEQIATQLRAEMARSDSGLGRDAALLLAYLGHIKGIPLMAEQGLLEFGKRSDPADAPEAALLELLRGVWLKE